MPTIDLVYKFRVQGCKGSGFEGLGFLFKAVSRVGGGINAHRISREKREAFGVCLDAATLVFGVQTQRGDYDHPLGLACLAWFHDVAHATRSAVPQELRSFADVPKGMA
jgi:hypothetical protein